MTRLLYESSLSDVEKGALLQISGDELHYLRKVRRHKCGDTVTVQDQSGTSFAAVIVEIQKQVAILQVGEHVDAGVEPWPIHLLSAVPKGKILDEVIRKLNELGVQRFTPVICERSSVVPRDHRVERWRRIAVQSMRQCRRTRPLEIGEPVRFEEAVALDADHKHILHPSSGVAAGELMSQRTGGGDVVMLVGPEGGFVEAEVGLASRHQFTPVQFGKTILRIETALIVASVTCVTILGGLDGASTGETQ